jgi:hypothetical protein
MVAEKSEEQKSGLVVIRMPRLALEVDDIEWSQAPGFVLTSDRFQFRIAVRFLGTVANAALGHRHWWLDALGCVLQTGTRLFVRSFRILTGSMFLTSFRTNNIDPVTDSL